MKMESLVFVLALASTVWSMQSDQPSIQFLLEPPHRLEFSNSTGALLDCAAHGHPQPQIEWITSDGSPATAIAGLRRPLPNGSLELVPFAGARYRRDVHAAVYRCRARSAAGLVLSRECHVNAVITQMYEVKVYDEYVMAGNNGVLRCAVPAHAAARVSVSAWLQDGALAIYPDSDIGGKYTMLHGGELHISSANQADGFIAFTCRTQDRLTGEIQTSTYPGHVILTEPKGSVQPRATLEKHSARRAAVGERVLLACVAQGWPVPTYRWFKEHRDQLIGLESSERMAVTAGGLLRIAKVRLEDHGKYLCWVNNTAGEETVQVTLIVTAPLTIHITPAVQTVDAGADATLTCNARGWPAPRTRWLQAGAPRGESARLELRALAREHAGLYQCVAANEWEQAVAIAEVRLGDARPEVVYWFSEQTMQAGPALSLKCVATGSPPPHFTWTLDGFPLPDNTRFVVGQHVSSHDDVVSHMNMSRVTEQDGGEFACIAANTAGRARHAGRVNIYGLPYIREMPRLTVVAGHDLVVKCPVAGYPIESITWERDGQLLPLNRRQRVFPNGTLQVEQAQRAEDAGTYTCQAANRQRHAARRDLEVQIIVQPKILPIQPMTNLLREGMRAAITCQILEGDLPITFKWEKDGEPVLPSSYGGAGAGIITRRLDEYSASLVIETVASAHSGNYTCVASNVAGTERFTVPLTVNVPPRWTTEPTDASAAAGQDVALECQADGYPAPTITWKKAVGMAPGEYKDFLFEPNVSLYPNGSLVFFRVTKDSEGHYLCEARNNIGTGVSKVIFLKVNAPARFPTKSKTVQVVAKEQAHLQCAATGDNPIDINWRSPHHHSLANHLDQRYTIREQILDDGMVSELGIMHAYRQDTGTLTCTASNAYGHEMTIQLVVQEEPEMPKNIRIIDQQSRSIQISWTQPYSGNSPIINYIVQYKSGGDSWIANPAKVIVPGSLTTATVQNLHPARSYHLRIIAENRLGQSEPSQVIQVTTLEEVPGGPPLEIRAEAKSSTELAVTWEPPQRDLWNGNILGYYIGYQEVLPNSTHLLATAFLSTSTQLPTQSHAYTVKTVEAGAHGSGEASLGGLERYTSYAVIVQAYNSRGAGPASLPITAVTMEDAPSLPPDNVHCSVLSSQSIRVSWEMPPSRGRNGVIQGYKVSHTPMQEWYGKDEQVTKQITGLRTTLSGLRRYTNYSVSVAAFTNAGDGVKSPPVYCHTEEDVPSAPADIKAVVSSMNKILVSWLPPEHPNGILVGYTFYMSIIEDGREEGTHKRILSPNTGSHETIRTQEEATHQFWLTASTRVGEGESTRVVTILPSDKVPARITSFSRQIITPWKENVTLPCNKVGIPHPSTTWSLQGNVLEPSPRKNVTLEGILIISMTQYADSGNYTCVVENSHGRDDITYSVHVKVPPQPPILAVVDSYADSLHLQWTDQGDGGSTILGYVINYKREHGDWEELQVEAGTMEHVLPNLWCGTRYQLYITAFNKIGTGLPCDIVNAFTKGTVPVKPKHSQMITLNTTVVTVWLDSWGDGGCGILYFVIEYREQSNSQWRLVSNSVQATERVFSVTGLSAATQYQLKITAHNNAGFAVALYNFTTHSIIGGLEPELSPPVSHSGNGDRTFYGGARVLLPASLSLLVLAALIAIVFLVRRSKVTQCGAAGARGVGESPSAAQLQNKVNRDAQYLAARGRQPVPVGVEDTPPYKSEANEYMEDICPYATFQLSKPTAYSESSYSGNVYSGPYHSVRGSFVYHDVKQSDKYKSGHGKEPEYTKVRRKGGRLRDPHSESQESDNLGSTDSEVKKILTLHLPITEYEDDGTDEGSGPGSESEGASRRPRRHAAPAPSFAPEESSSSSETSLGGVVRKAFPSRKGKAGLQGKRHVRSSSGYSSHNDETTFSISNYPSFNEHIHPPSRFSDDTECDTSLHHRRRRALLSHAQNDGKLTREAFQINV